MAIIAKLGTWLMGLNHGGLADVLNGAFAVLLVFGGYVLTFASFLYIIRMGWGFFFTGVPGGRYYPALLALVAGPLLAWNLVSAMGASGSGLWPIAFGWAYAPSLAAAWCLEDDERAQQPAAAAVVSLYGVGVGVYIFTRFADLLARGADVGAFLFVTAGAVALGYAVMKSDETRRQGAIDQARAVLEAPAAPAAPIGAHDWRADMPASPAPPQAPLRPAPASLADDFDVPPQR